MKIKAHTFSLILLFFSLTLSLLFPQESEDEPYLWSYGLGDSEADLYWDGYWLFSLSGSLAFDKDSKLDAVYPGFIPGIRFMQTPDLLLSLWMDNRFFFETSVVEDYDKNTYLLGYQGAPDEYLREVRIGNSSIGVDSFADLSPSSPSYNTPGLTVKGKTETMTNEFMVRFDGTREDSRLYVGPYEVSEEYWEIFDYRRSSRFLLPDVSPESIVFYLEDPSGPVTGSSGRTYSPLKPGDFLLNRERGEVTLNTPLTGRLLVYYEIEAIPLGEEGLGEASIIPPTFTGSGIPDVSASPVDFSWNDADLYQTGLTYGQTRRESLDGRDMLILSEPGRFSPFLVCAAYHYEQRAAKENWRNRIILTERFGTESHSPDDFSWEFSPDGTQAFIYRRNQDRSSGLYRYPLGDILPELYGNAPVNREELVPYQLLYQIKQSQNGYRLGSQVVPGSVEIFLNGRRENNYRLDPDTGALTFDRYIFPTDRIEIRFRRESPNFQGQEMMIYQGNRFTPHGQHTLEQALSFNWVFPDGQDSSTPDGGELNGGVSWRYRGEILTLETGIKGRLDLGDADGYQRIAGMESGGQSLTLFDDMLAEPVPDDDYPLSLYESFPAVLYEPDAAPFDGKAARFLPDLDTNRWTGMSVLLDRGNPVDLTHLTSFHFYYRNGGESPLPLRIFLGENGEREDGDDSGFIDPSDDTLRVDRWTTALTGGWNRAEFFLTGEERQKLSRCRSLQIVLSQNDGWTGSGDFEIGGLELTGSTFTTSVLGDSDNSASVGLTEIGDVRLAQDFPREFGLFHRDGSNQRVARIEWDGLGSNETWRAVKWLDERNLSRFGHIVFFVSHDGGGGDFSVDLTDTDGRGVHLSWNSPASDTGWQKVTIDLEKKKASFSHGADDVRLTVDAGTDSLNRIALTGGGPTSGVVLFDEFYFSSPVIAGEALATVRLAYQGDDLLIGPQGFPWLDKLDLDLQTRGSVNRQWGGLDRSAQNASLSALLGLEPLFIDLEIALDGSWDGSNLILFGSHSLGFPLTPSPVNVRESFSYGDGLNRPLYSRTTGIRLSPLPSMTLDFTQESHREPSQLSQDWEGDVTLDLTGFSARVNGHLAQTSTGSFAIGRDYGSVWLNSFEDWIPYGIQEKTRDIQGKGEGRFDADRWSLSGEIWGTTGLSYQPNLTSKHTLSGTLSLPMEWLGGELIVTPRYERSLTLWEKTAAFGSWQENITTWQRSLLPLLPLANSLPFGELISQGDRSFSDPALTYRYAPEFSLQLERTYGARLLDLYLPYQGEGKFSRTYASQDGTSFYDTQWEFTLRQRALNLFGAFGVSPLVKFYATDEIGNSLTCRFDGRNVAFPTFSGFGWNGYLYFQGLGGERFTLENDLSWQREASALQDRLSAAFQWQRGRKPYRKIPLTPYLLDRESYLSHRETLTFDYSLSESTEKGEITVAHNSTLHMEDLGTLMGELQLGGRFEDDHFILGLQWTVELKLTF